MRKALLAALALLLILPTLSCDNGGGGGGGTTANSTSVVDSNWVNAKGREVPYDLFGLNSVSTGRGRGLPEGVTVVVVNRPGRGTLSKSNTYYTPVADYVGQDSFTFQLADASGKVCPQVYKLTFSRVDAEPPIYEGLNFFSVNRTSGQRFCHLEVRSPGGVTMRVNFSLLKSDSNPQPAMEATQKLLEHPPDVYRFNFYGNFTGCQAGNWLFAVGVTWTDPAGNKLAVSDILSDSIL